MAAAKVNAIFYGKKEKYITKSINTKINHYFINGVNCMSYTWIAN
jgi:hypothetical protein